MQTILAADGVFQKLLSNLPANLKSDYQPSVAEPASYKHQRLILEQGMRILKIHARTE